jgi:uncharacterized protein (DUF885 family)
MGEAARVLDTYWDRFLAAEPLFATLVGDSRFDDVLPDPAEDGRAERHRVHAGLLAAPGGIDAARLVPEERRALALAVALARRELGCLTYGMDRLWAVGHMPIGFRFGPGLLLGVVAFQQPGGTAPQRAAYLRRLAAFPAYLDALAANAREGLAAGVVASRWWSRAPSGRSNGCWPRRWPTAPRWRPLAAAGRRRARGRPGRLLPCRDRRAGRDVLRQHQGAAAGPRPGRDQLPRGQPGPPPADRAGAGGAGPSPAPPLRLGVTGRGLRRRLGLYSKRLADEMGLYAGDHERLGMLDLQALRTARLVADTGIHAFGWTRERSIATLRASGCDEWVGGGGDVSGFHDALLALGLLPLASLRAELAAEATRPRGPAP